MRPRPLDVQLADALRRWARLDADTAPARLWLRVCGALARALRVERRLASPGVACGFGRRVCMECHVPLVPGEEDFCVGCV